MNMVSSTIRKLVIENLKSSGRGLTIIRSGFNKSIFTVRQGDNPGRVFLGLYKNILRMHLCALFYEARGNDSVDTDFIGDFTVYDKFMKSRWKTRKHFAKFYSDLVVRYFDCLPFAVDMLREYHKLFSKYYDVAFSEARAVLIASGIGKMPYMLEKGSNSSWLKGFKLYLYGVSNQGDIELPIKVERVINDECNGYRDSLIVDRHFENSDLLSDLILVYLENNKYR